MTNKLRKGGSLSGRERNCAFLNLDGSRFATISGLSGFDFPDDARALALVDWNGDGLMDVWTSNRTAPRLRFLQNQVPSDKGWIQFELHSNTFLDPIGSRVEVTLSNGQVLLRSLRAGEGFLGQSTRVLHFGLGDGELKSLRVRWPDGTWQTYPTVPARKRYLLAREAPESTPLPIETTSIPTGGALDDLPSPESPWIRLPMELPLPPLLVTHPDGKTVFLPPADGKPMLINLWDPTCADCGTELEEWTTNRARFPADLKIAALLANSETGEEEAAEFFSSRQIPFARGRLVPDSTQLLARFLQELFQTRDSFAAPASFLLDGEGHLISFALGMVTVDQIVSELKAMLAPHDTPAARLARVYGPAGNWLDPEKYQNLLFVPRALMAQGQVDLAALYVRRGWPHLSRHRDIDLVLVWIGDEYFKKGRAGEGLNFHLNALKNGTKDPIVMNNVAWQLATHPADQVRNGPLAVQWAEKAVEVTGGKQATYFDTLAAAYAETGQYDKALAAVSTGLKLAREESDPTLIKGLLEARDLYTRKTPRRSR